MLRTIWEGRAQSARVKHDLCAHLTVLRTIGLVAAHSTVLLVGYGIMKFYTRAIVTRNALGLHNVCAQGYQVHYLVRCAMPHWRDGGGPGSGSHPARSHTLRQILQERLHVEERQGVRHYWR